MKKEITLKEKNEIIDNQITISELKKIMFPGFHGCFLLDNGTTVDIHVNGGNILKLNSCTFPWYSLIEKFEEWGKVRLCTENPKRFYDFIDGVLVKEFGHGGRRVPGPDRKLGRPVSGLAPKKKVCITLSPELIDLMKLQPTFVSVSSFIDSVLVDYFDDVLSNGES